LNWQQQATSGFRNCSDLLDYLEIPNTDRSHVLEHHRFSMKVPLSFANRMNKNDIHCPLLKQVLPIAAENDGITQSQSVPDPLQEREFLTAPGVLHKFQNRFLVIASGYCPVNCRYCFRREFDYENSALSLADWNQRLNELKNTPDIEEVILSGGDPLTLSDRRLAMIINDLRQINSIKAIRIHTRFPVMIPDRLTDELLEIVRWKNTESVRITIVLHINHPNEINDELHKKLKHWNQSGVLFLNQSVLLKGVNDSVLTLKKLSYRCFESGVMPYYLHQLDRVSGAMHFEVPLSEGQKIASELRTQLPGYLVPLYVQEIPHAKSKVPLISMCN